MTPFLLHFSSFFPLRGMGMNATTWDTMKDGMMVLFSCSDLYICLLATTVNKTLLLLSAHSSPRLPSVA